MAVMDSIQRLQTEQQRLHSIEALVRQIYADQGIPLDEAILQQALALNGETEEALLARIQPVLPTPAPIPPVSATEPPVEKLPALVEPEGMGASKDQETFNPPTPMGVIGLMLGLVLAIWLGHVLVSPSSPHQVSNSDRHGFEQMMGMVTSSGPITRAQFDAISDVGGWPTINHTNGAYVFSRVNPDVCGLLVDRAEFSQTHRNGLKNVPVLTLDGLPLATTPVATLRQACQRPVNTLEFVRPSPPKAP